jgi:ABC-type polysaccharide/polyol phosphate export permease
MTHLIRLLFYVSPALYAIWMVPNETLQMIMSLNPLSVLLTAYRTVTWGTETVDHGTQPNFAALFLVLVLGFVLLSIGVALFKRVEAGFARIL